MSASQEVLDKLAEFDTPTICNVIELFDVQPRNRGYMDGRVKSNFPEFPPMVGFACTASFRSDAPPVGGDAYGSIQRQLAQFEELPGPAVVCFQDLDDPAVSAVFGEVMCSTYQAYGSVGLVTNGGGRDLEQVKALNYPVFTGSTICSHGYCHMLHLGLPVRIEWARDYRGKADVIYGHTPMAEAEWLNHTLCIDTGCPFGGRLTALRWPEREIVSVASGGAYARRVRAFGHPPARPARAPAGIGS